MKTTFYTIWKQLDGETDATLLDNYGCIKFRAKAFKIAKKEADDLVRDFKSKILVRKITIGDTDCLEWEFMPID